MDNETLIKQALNSRDDKVNLLKEVNKVANTEFLGLILDLIDSRITMAKDNDKHKVSIPIDWLTSNSPVQVSDKAKELINNILRSNYPFLSSMYFNMNNKKYGNKNDKEKEIFLGLVIRFNISYIIQILNLKGYKVNFHKYLSPRLVIRW